MAELPPEITVLARKLRADVLGAEVIQEFHDEGIPCILMKGPALARLLYASAGERGYGDVDLLVPPDDYERAGRTLERMGFRCSDPAPRIPLDRPIEGREWSREDGAIDLHQSIPETELEPEDAWDYLWPRTQQELLRGVAVSVLDVPRRALLVGLHAAHHGASFPQALEDLRRAIVLLTRAVWTEAVVSARYLKCEDALAAGLRLLPEGRRLASDLGLPEDTWTKGRLRMGNGGPQSLGVALAMERMRGLSGVKTRMAYLARKLFPPARYMREWLRVNPGRGGLPGAYIRRLMAYAGHSLEGARRWWAARRDTQAPERDGHDGP